MIKAKTEIEPETWNPGPRGNDRQSLEASDSPNEGTERDEGSKEAERRSEASPDGLSQSGQDESCDQKNFNRYHAFGVAREITGV